MSEGREDRLFSLAGRIVIITGGAGFLGRQHVEAIAEYGGVPVLLDIDEEAARTVADEVRGIFGIAPYVCACDVTREEDVHEASRRVMAEFGRVDVLINNAANNPKVENSAESTWSRMESLPISVWDRDIAVGLTGAFICSRTFGKVMAGAGRGSIINIGSDLGLIGPDQRLYRQEGLADRDQPVKPVTYSVVKSALVGFTRYLATYWAECGVRANYLAPGGMEFGQDEKFLARISERIPMRRMARHNEYKGAVVFLASDASSYMTGAVISIDGGRTTW